MSKGEADSLIRVFEKAGFPADTVNIRAYGGWCLRVFEPGAVPEDSRGRQLSGALTTRASAMQVLDRLQRERV